MAQMGEQHIAKPILMQDTTETYMYSKIPLIQQLIIWKSWWCTALRKTVPRLVMY